MIGVYAGPGVDGQGLRYLLDTLHALSFSTCLLDDEALCTSSWEKDLYALIMPGGRDLLYHSALDGQGTDRIRAYVEQGGGYLGICAGAYFACSSIAFERGGELEVCGQRSLAFFSGVAEGPAYGLGLYSYHSRQGAVAASISSKTQGPLFAYFNGGCTFVGDDPEVTILSSYLDLPGQPPAIIYKKIGKGWVCLSGVHIEFSSQSLDGTDPYLQKIILQLASKEKQRQELFASLLFAPPQRE